jgi:hypothetical protein
MTPYLARSGTLLGSLEGLQEVRSGSGGGIARSCKEMKPLSLSLSLSLSLCLCLSCISTQLCVRP